MKPLCFVVLIVLASRLLAAQTPDPATPQPTEAPAAPAQPPATGSITGHVVLGDSHLPARMALVMLLPVSGAEAGDKQPALSSGAVQTGLDGAFVMPNVLPGAYYVVAAKLGYATTIPISYLDPDDYSKAPKEVKEALAEALAPVVVAANRASRADIVLDRGAVISGTVRFDDGESYSQASVSLLHKEKSGNWTEFAAQEGLFTFPSGGAPTDDQGNFRLTGLPPGEYLLRTTLALQGGGVTSPGAEPSHEPDYRWDIYFGYGIRPSDAKIIKLKEGEQSIGNTIEIPLAKLHSISGTVVSTETSAPINSAQVELHNFDDDSTCSVTRISSAGQFHFPYVAEGEYTLKVTGASDPALGSHSPANSDAKQDHTYVDTSQTLIVKGEMNGVTLTVKPQAAAAAIAPKR